MKRGIWVCWLVLLLAGCGVPQRFSMPASDAGVQASALSESEKNLRARLLVQDLRRRFGVGAATGIRSVGEHAARYRGLVQAFGERSAVPYSENSASIDVLVLIVERRDSTRGFGLQTFEVTVLLARSLAVNDGVEVLYSRTETGSCNAAAVAPYRCDAVQDALAATALYSLQKEG